MSELGQAAGGDVLDCPGGLPAFIRLLAHQVRNPLFGITAILDLLEAERPADETLRNTLSDARSQVARIGRILQDLTDLVADEPIPAPPASVSETVVRAVGGAQAGADAAGVKIEVRIEEGNACVPLQSDRLVRVWRALLDQAISQSPRGSEVRVEVSVLSRRDRPEVQVRIADGGGGLGHVAAARALEPFALRRRGDTGLELAAARWVVHVCGGRVEARALDGGGCVFDVRLPSTPPGGL